MATRKHSSKPKLAAVPAPAVEPSQDRNPLIADDPRDTLDRCADVLEFLCEFHLREGDIGVRAIEIGEYQVLRVLQHALRTQSKESANG
jgi:hypothetical protein